MALKLKKKNTQVKKIVKKATRSAQKSTTPVKTVNADLSYPTGEYVEAIGRRKVATARVRLYTSKGDFIINDKIAGDYFNVVPLANKFYNEPFELTGTQGKYSVTVQVSGSGTHAQLDAIRLGISRALVKINPEYKALLKERDLLTRDDRMKETRKIGMGGSARRPRQSPKR